MATKYSEVNTSLIVLMSDNCLRLPLPYFIPCVSSRDFINEAARKVVNNSIYVIVVPDLFIIGIITNVLNCVVFHRQDLQDRVNSLLFMLSFLDLLYIITLYGRYFNYKLDNFFGKEIRIEMDMALIRFHFVGVPHSIAVISNLVSKLISVDRCVHIALPLQVQGLVSRRVFGVIFGVVSLALVCSNETILFSYDTVCVYYSDSQVQPTWLVIPSTFYMKNKTFLDILDTVVMNSIVPFLSLSVTAVTTVITTVKLKSAMMWPKGFSRSSKLCGKEIALTRMLVVISSTYIACVCPRVLTSMTRLLIPDYRPWRRLCTLVVVMETLLNGLYAFNSVVNFFVYLSLGTKFKQTLRRVMLLNVSKNCRK